MAQARIPLWLKLAYTAWMLVWIPSYWIENGPGNFLWFCDVANLALWVALLLESPLLLSSQAAGVFLIQVAWVLDFGAALLFGIHPVGGTEYMFDAAEPLWVRGLSLFHAAVPVLLLWGISRLGYDRRGWKLQSAIAWVVLPASFLLTDPEQNINWLWEPFGVEQTWMPPAAFLAVAMVIYPLGVFLPTHALLAHLARRLHGRDGVGRDGAQRRP